VKLARLVANVQTQALGVRIENRKKVDADMTNFINKLSVSKQFIDAISNAPIGDVFFSAVTELHEKLQFVAKLPPNTPSLGDVSPDMHNLRGKVGYNVAISGRACCV
jgi:hypothetical protein